MCACVPVSPPTVAALTEALEAEKVKKVPNVGVCPCRVSPHLPFLSAVTPTDVSSISMCVPRFTGNLSAASCSFLLYNEDHRKCVEARGQQLMVTTCQPDATAQRFQWLQGGRLRGWGSQHCITATRGQSWAVVGLEPCRDDSELQRWECRDGGLLALVGYDLYFNYGNHPQHTVMLYTGNREWSRWVVHGSKDDVCSRSCQSWHLYPKYLGLYLTLHWTKFSPNLAQIQLKLNSNCNKALN